jgi:hypothetical protein
MKSLEIQDRRARMKRAERFRGGDPDFPLGILDRGDDRRDRCAGTNPAKSATADRPLARRPVYQEGDQRPDGGLPATQTGGESGGRL